MVPGAHSRATTGRLNAADVSATRTPIVLAEAVETRLLLFFGARITIHVAEALVIAASKSVNAASSGRPPEVPAGEDVEVHVKHRLSRVDAFVRHDPIARGRAGAPGLGCELEEVEHFGRIRRRDELTEIARVAFGNREHAEFSRRCELHV